MLDRVIGEDLDLTVQPEANLWLIKADAGQMEQIIMNLVINARDAMPQGGKLTIETANVVLGQEYVESHPESHAGEHVRLAVSDTGCGMDRATIARIFEPFFTTKGPEKGTGLGLATVYGIVKQSGGHIEVYSEPKLGTAFKIYLPRERAAMRSGDSRPQPNMTPLGSETIMLAEDDSAVRRLSRLVLERNGYTVLEAKHGEEALLICEQYKNVIHLLITDVVMPNMSGRQLVERLVALRPDMKILYVSGYTDDAVVRHGVLDAKMPFLQKPFAPGTLALKVREILDQHVV
jgi:CheY-like chemotaxis protein